MAAFNDGNHNDWIDDIKKALVEVKESINTKTDQQQNTKFNKTVENVCVTSTQQSKYKNESIKHKKPWSDDRSQSRVFYMRNFHNWVKGRLINEYLTKIKDYKKSNEPVRVHDLCCGKGGDLLKWYKGDITHLICSNKNADSLEECQIRYQKMLNKSYHDRNPGNLYTIEYIVADCSRITLKEKYKDPLVKLDLVSCQFALQRSFESLPQAECIIKNAAECLQPGGYFIGTIPDANELMVRVQKSDTNSFGNNVYNITFDFDTTAPLFGNKYIFHLEGLVDSTEFLVHFPLLVKLAKKYGLKLVKKENFLDFYTRMKLEGIDLLTKMNSLETYPAQQGTKLVGNADDDYEHARLFLEMQDRNLQIGTLSKSEWEISSFYLTFAFEKV